MQEQVSEDLEALPHICPGGDRSDKWRAPLPPPMKKQTAKPPPIFNLSVTLPIPAGWGIGLTLPPPPEWEPGLAQGGTVACPFPFHFHYRAAGSELRTQGMGRVWDLALRHPLPHRVPCSPLGGGFRGLAARAADLGEGKQKGGTVEMPAPRPQRHLPSATYRGSFSSQGRGRSSSERSVRPTVPLKGTGTNQLATEESRGIAAVRRIPVNCPLRPKPCIVSLLKSS